MAIDEFRFDKLSMTTVVNSDIPISIRLDRTVDGLDYTFCCCRDSHSTGLADDYIHV